MILYKIVLYILVCIKRDHSILYIFLLCLEKNPAVKVRRLNIERLRAYGVNT